MPATHAANLQGDAHLKQYAVRETGRGLADFDDTASGPAVFDLVRFSTSLVLTCRERGWSDAIDSVLNAFLRGYRAALADPGLTNPEPRIVARLRSALPVGAAPYFAWLCTVTEPVTADVQAAVRASLVPYVDAMVAREPALGREYFQVSKSRRSAGRASESAAHTCGSTSCASAARRTLPMTTTSSS